MLRCVAVVLCSMVLSSSAFAQVIYLPVKYQFDAGRGDQKYFYGGTDPLVHRMAQQMQACQLRGNGGVNLHRFDGGNSFGQPAPFSPRQAVYSDCVAYKDASWFGYTAADARNEAYANAPTYFRKADLLATAVQMPDGALVVPPTAPEVFVVPMSVIGGNAGMTSQASMPRRGQIIIIPKRLLDKPLKDFDGKPLKVASAQ